MTRIPESFVYLADVDPSIIQSVRYATPENFVGEIVDGYASPVIVCKSSVARALRMAQHEFNKRGYGIVVYDAYRPRRAVAHFVRWSKTDQIIAKGRYYPSVKKADLFTRGFISDRSVHCKGYAVDLTIIPWGQRVKEIEIKQVTLKNGTVVPFLDDGTLDMGTSFDLFDDSSFAMCELISEQAALNRRLLRHDDGMRFRRHTRRMVALPASSR